MNNQFFLGIRVRTRVVTSFCLPVTNVILVQGCENPGPVNFLTMAHDIFSIVLLFTSHLSCIQTRVSVHVYRAGRDCSEMHR